MAEIKKPAQTRAPAHIKGDAKGSQKRSARTDPPKWKLETVTELKDLVSGSKTVLIASIKNLPGSQFQEIVKKLRGQAVVKVPKKNLILRAIDEAETKEGEKLKGSIGEAVAILFSESDAFDLSLDLLRNKSPAKAKVGQIAPLDIIVSAGPTDLVPGPAISELGALGIQIQIKDGKIAIKEDKVLVKEGEEISSGAAAMMSKLDIKPFSIGFLPLSALDTKENKFYAEIKIDIEGALENLKADYGKALSFAVSMGYVSKDTISHLLAKANAHGTKVHRIMTGEPEPVAVEAPAEESKPEKKEEPKKEAAAEGLGALFG